MIEVILTSLSGARNLEMMANKGQDLKTQKVRRDFMYLKGLPESLC